MNGDQHIVKRDEDIMNGGRNTINEVGTYCE